MSIGITIGTGLGRGGGVHDPLAYTNKVKALSPIAYWPLADASGTTATDESGNGRNGTYVNGVTLGATGIGDGRTAVTLDGSNDVIDIYSASFNGAFTGQLFSVSIWLKPTNAAAYRNGLWLNADSGHYFALEWSSGEIAATYSAGGVTVSESGALSNGAWSHVGVTVTKAGDALKLYINGSQAGVTQTGLGTWSGNLIDAYAVLGGQDNTGTNSWLGGIAHAAFFNSALSAATMTSLASV